MQPGSKSISSNFLYNFIKTFASIVFPIITFSYSSRILGAEGIGKINFSKSIISYFSLFAMLGINRYGTREVAKLGKNHQQLNKFICEMLIINSITTAFAYVLLILVVSFSPVLQGYKNILRITSMSIFLSSMGMEWLYQGLEEYRYIAVRSMIFQFIALMAMFMSVKDEKDIVNYAAVNLVASSGSYVFNFWHSRKYICFSFCDKMEIRKHLKPILWLFAFAVSVELYTVLDSTMLGLLKGDEAVGIYTAGVKVNKMVNSLISSLGIVLLPRFSYFFATENIKEIKSLLAKAYNYVFMLSIPAFLGLFFLSDKIILLFGGVGFKSAGITMRLLTPIVLIIPFNSLTTDQVFVAMNQEKKILYSTLTGATVNFMCNMVLIPIWAENGAAVATVIAEFAVMCVCLFNGKKQINYRNIFKNYWQYWVAAIPILGFYVLLELTKMHYLLEIIFFVFGSAFCYFYVLHSFNNEYLLMVCKSLMKKIHIL